MADPCTPCRGTGTCIECNRELMKAFAACIYCEGTRQCLYCLGTGELPEISEKDWKKLCRVQRPRDGLDDAIEAMFGDRLVRLGDRKFPSPDEIDDFHRVAWDQKRFQKMRPHFPDLENAPFGLSGARLSKLRAERRVGLDLWRAARELAGSDPDEVH